MPTCQARFETRSNAGVAHRVSGRAKHFPSCAELAQRVEIKLGEHLQGLRAFFRFAHDRQWVESNRAARIKLPKTSVCPTMPSTSERFV
jgi:hypothetical protein